MASSIDPLAPAVRKGALVGERYRLLRRVAGGGMSTVFEATDERTDRVRAVKILHPSIASSESHRRRFEREARVTARIVSEHVIDILDAGVDADSGSPYLVMPLLAGRDLAAEIEARGALDPATALEWLAQIAGALDAAHAAQVVHRDLKPANVFVTKRDDDSTRLVVLDFGIAKLLDRVSTRPTEAILGSPLYLAPEQVRYRKETVTGRADVYALGQLTYTALVGEPYYAVEDESADGVMGLLMEMALGATEPATVRARARRGIELAPGFDAWFAKATAREPEDRFARASEAVAALAEAIAEACPRIPQRPSTARDDAGSSRAEAAVTTAAQATDAPFVEPPPAPSRAHAPRAAPRRRSFALVLGVPAVLLAALGASRLLGARGASGEPATREEARVASVAAAREEDGEPSAHVAAEPARNEPPLAPPTPATSAAPSVSASPDARVRPGPVVGGARPPAARPAPRSETSVPRDAGAATPTGTGWQPPVTER